MMPRPLARAALVVLACVGCGAGRSESPDAAATVGSGSADVGHQQVAEALAAAEPPPMIPVISEPGAVDIEQRFSMPADRLDPYTLESSCDLTTAAAIIGRQGLGQYIIVRADSWAATTARVDVVVASAEAGSVRVTCQRGDQDAMVGRSGTVPILDRRSGDGTTPAGSFPLGEVTAWDGEVFSFFGNSPNPGTRAGYRAVRPGDCWGATPGAATYNKLYRSTSCPGPDDEYLPRITGAYAHAAVIGANLADISGDAPGETPYAAAIFLHRHAYDSAGLAKATSGCVSLAIEDLVATIDLIDPAHRPRFVIGTTDWLRTAGYGG